MTNQFSHAFHPTILREYDIRGIVDETLFAADAKAIGWAFGTRVKQNGGRVVCVGYDGRLSSPMMEAALVEGLTEVGVDVKRVGRGPTPMLYYATHAFKADGGIMVTGSHNPPSHNGFKMVLAGKPFFGDDIRRMGEVLDRAAPSQQLGKIEHTGMLMHYVERLLQDYVPGKALNVVWDAGNGAAGEAMQELTERLPGTHTLLFADIDGTFPNHHPDPTVPKNLVDLQKAVAEKGADLGIAFDGDGDRIGIIDGQGRILFGDQILALMAEDMLKDIPGATIIADVKASKVLFDEIAAYGGQPLMWRTGHSLIKTKMAETKAPLAGEMSGHIFYADKYYGFDDALYAAVRFLSIVARSEVSLAERFDALPKMVNTPEMRIDCDDERKFTVIDEVRARLLGVQGIDVDATDGVRVTSENGWWLLRASNTQAVLVARCEAESEAKLAILQNELQNQLKESGVAA